MSLIDLNMLSMLVEDLNSEIAYQVSGALEIPMQDVTKALRMNTEGDDHQIWFYGLEIWSAKVEGNLEQLTPEQQIEVNTREHFEQHLRMLIMDQVNAIAAIDI